MRLEFWGQVLEKLLIVKFHENPSVGNGVVPCGKTYRQTWQSSLSLFVTLRMCLIRRKWCEASSQYKYSGNRTQISTNYILRPTENWVNSPTDYINFTHKRWKPRHQCLSNLCYCWRSCKEIIKLSFRTSTSKYESAHRPCLTSRWCSSFCTLGEYKKIASTTNNEVTVWHKLDTT